MSPGATRRPVVHAAAEVSRAAELLAGRAQAEYVEPVTLGLESRFGGQVADGARNLLLEAGREGDVSDLPAVDAQQVMMMFGEILSQLEAGELVAGGDPPDHPGGLQIGQMAIRGAARQLGQPLGDLADAHRMTRTDQQLDDCPSAARVPLVDPPQPPFGDAVQIVGVFIG